MIKREYDAIVIGSGHNGMCLAAYLARAGMEVAIFERRHEEGGPVYTSECTAPGFLHNLHAQYLAFMDWMPFYYDFELEKLGARTIIPENQCGIAFSDGRPPIVLYSLKSDPDLKRTHRSIAQYSKEDADTYVELRKKAREFRDLFALVMYNPPVMPSETDPDPMSSMGVMAMQAMGLPPHLAKGSARALIDTLFTSPEVRAMLYRQVEEFGPPLEMMGGGALGLQGLFFISLTWRLCLGGTHAMAHAMAMACVREGVDIYESCEVRRILVKNGKAVGIRLADGTEVKARKLVASNADLHQTMLGMVGEENLSPLWVSRVRNFRVRGTNVLASTAMALHEAPKYKSARWNPDINKTFYTIVGYDTPEEVARYSSDAHGGALPIPAAGTWVNSLWDPTYAPKGKHSLCGWFFFPHANRFSAAEWEEIRATYNDRFLERFKRWAPNMTRENVIADYFYTPIDQESEMRMTDMSNGDITPNQLGWARPFPEAAHYRTEIEGLYLCGPFTHPFGAVHGGCGYNAFKICAQDFGLEKFWESHARGY
jgi:phytoene dehydrogenase-like protein